MLVSCVNVSARQLSVSARSFFCLALCVLVREISFTSISDSNRSVASLPLSGSSIITYVDGPVTGTWTVNEGRSL